MLARGAVLGRRICLVLGIALLAIALLGTAGNVEARDRDGAPLHQCGGLAEPNDVLSSGCGLALQAHAQAAMLTAMIGVGLLVGAIALSLGPRQPDQRDPRDQPDDRDRPGGVQHNAPHGHDR